jgi:Icc-related predicted phosphoesterase
MPRIAVYSDLHLEFAPWKPPRTGADFAVLAGDLYTRNRCLPASIGDARDAFGCPVVAVLGNHEHYGEKVERTLEKTQLAAERLGVTLLENQDAVIAGVRVLGCTLWTDFRLFAGDDDVRMKLDAVRCADGLTDFRVIRVAGDGYRRFRPKDAGTIHRASVAWLKERLAVPFDGPTVVLTHHAPSKRSIPAGYAEDPLSAAYASNLDHLIEEFGPALWVHGHVHESFDYRIGATRVVCNPRGYLPSEPNLGFREDLVIEV